MGGITHDQQGGSTGRCALCMRYARLQKSHVIPKFVGKYLKNTSATGYLARATNAKRVQDLDTYRLLCRDCEQRFSKLEKYFADKIFHPSHGNGVGNLDYDNRLKLFAISLGWRALKIGYETVKSLRPEFGIQMKQAEFVWREFLLNDGQTACPYESHLFFLNNLDLPTDVPEKFEWYSLRAADCTIVSNNSRVFTYVKLADMVFVTSIHPMAMAGWKGTRIKQNGSIPRSCTIDDGMLWEFLLHRAKEAFASPTRPSPEVQEKRLQKAFDNDPQRFLESDSMRVGTSAMVSRYRRRMDGMSDSVRSLAVVIGNQAAYTKAETVVNVWSCRKILDALAELSAEEDAELDNGIRAAIGQSSATGSGTKYRLRANSIWITFMANNNSTKTDQRVAISNEREKLAAEQPSGGVPIAVFSMNYEGNGVSFESAFTVPPNGATRAV